MKSAAMNEITNKSSAIIRVGNQNFVDILIQLR